MNQQIRFCKSFDGTRIAYAVTGKGPPLVKAPHWLTHLEYEFQSPLWRPWIEALSKDHTLVRMDERACGLSDWDVADISFEAWVRDLEAVVDAAELERFALFGASQGAPIAIEYAVRHPERVTHLVISGGYARGWLKRGLPPERVAELEAQLKLVGAGWGREDASYRQMFAMQFVPGATLEQINSLSELQRAASSPENTVRIIRTFFMIDVRDSAPRIKCPTLLLHGRGDRRAPFEEGRILASLIPGARLVPLETENHVLLAHEPAFRQFFEELRAFVPRPAGSGEREWGDAKTDDGKSDRLPRKLAAIFSADVKGYSRLMGEDEEATVRTLTALRKDAFALIGEFSGRVVDSPGDNVLGEFPSAVEAVRCAVKLQQHLKARNRQVPESRRMEFRIGINLGDVIVDGERIYGDGVNIAARLEGLAEAGGVMISESVRLAVGNRLPFAYELAGEHKLKNIAEPVRAYRLRVEEPSAPEAAIPRSSPSPELALPDKPSIAVLPFANMSGDPEQEYFADGMVEDIITELSRFQRLFVIARNTSFTYKGRSVDVKKVALELGVHFVLEGSVRKAGNRVRITAQLIDGETGRHVWAERYEDVLSDVFELQERITRQVVGSMVPEIEAEEMRLLERGQRRFTEADDISWRAAKAVTDAMFTGQAALTVDAIRLAEQAIERDRNCRLAWYVLSTSHVVRVFFGWTQDRRGSLDAARRASEMLMTLAPNDSLSYFVRGQVELLSGDFASGAADQRRAHALNPNDTTILFFLSWTEASAGNVERAKELAAQAIRMSPKDRRWLGIAHLAYAMSAFIEQDFKQLHDWAALAIQSQPAAPIRRVLMIAYAAEVGDTPLLRTHLEKVQSVAPDFIPSLFRGDYRPFHRPEHMKMLLDSLRKAGLEDPSAAEALR